MGVFESDSRSSGDCRHPQNSGLREPTVCQESRPGVHRLSDVHRLSGSGEGNRTRKFPADGADVFPPVKLTIRSSVQFVVRTPVRVRDHEEPRAALLRDIPGAGDLLGADGVGAFHALLGLRLVADEGRVSLDLHAEDRDGVQAAF